MDDPVKTRMFMIDETHGDVYTIPLGSIVWMHQSGKSSISWKMWVASIVNTCQDLNAFTNAEMIIFRSQSLAPTCVLQSHNNQGFIYAQVLELRNVPEKYRPYGVHNDTIGNLFLWPLSYNQHNVIWTKVCVESATTSSLRPFHPVQPPLISFSDDGHLAGPETRPRPCIVAGATKTSLHSELSTDDRLALMVFSTSPFLYRDGKAITERHVRASRKYVEEFPMTRNVKQRLATEYKKRRREKINDLCRKVGGKNTLGSIIQNAPHMVRDLRLISGLPIAANFVNDNEGNSCTESRKNSYFGSIESILPEDLQYVLIDKMISNIFSNTDTQIARQEFLSLVSSSRYNRKTAMFIANNKLMTACERVKEGLATGMSNNTSKVSRWTYGLFACSPLLLLELDLLCASKSKISNRGPFVYYYYCCYHYFDLRKSCAICKKICLVRGGASGHPTPPMAATRCLSSLDMDEAVQDGSGSQPRRANRAITAYSGIKNLLKVLHEQGDD